MRMTNRNRQTGTGVRAVVGARSVDGVRVVDGRIAGANEASLWHDGMASRTWMILWWEMPWRLYR